MIFNSDSYDALMAMEEARTAHYGEDYFDNGRPDDYWDVMADAKYEEERDERLRRNDYRKR